MSDSLQQKIHDHVLPHREEGPVHASPDEQRRRFMSAVHERKPSRNRVWIPVLAGVGAAVVLMVLFLQPKGPEEISFRIGEGTHGVPGDWVEAGPSEKSFIRFDGGTTYTLGAGSSVRVIHSNAQQVMVDLSHGKVNCSVHGNGTTKWVLLAGTYRVMVTGTVFQMQWQDRLKQLDVHVTKGSVQVTGARLNKHGVQLLAGDHLRVTAQGVSISPISTTQKEAVEPYAAPEQPAIKDVKRPSLPGKSAQEPTADNKKRTRNHHKEATWQELYRARDYEGTMDVAKKEGLDRIIRTASAGDLTKLSKAARYTRSSEDAVRVLSGMETRFAGTYTSHNATFLLGRVALELQHDSAAASAYFEKYLTAAPTGPLADESLGRLMEIYHRSGNVSGAKKAATTYLDKYPNGSFATLAHSVLK